jgi:hypothetical protein
MTLAHASEEKVIAEPVPVKPVVGEPCRRVSSEVIWTAAAANFF